VGQHKPRVLIVDDQPDITMYLSTVFDDHGYETSVATSGEDAYAQVLRQAPDLICLDVMMPEESGLALYRRLRDDARLARIPVVIVSAFAEAELDDQFAKGGVDGASLPRPDGYVEKPVDAADLVRAVEALLSEAG
jgi:CheY-like chemotaxis protein